nr:reverse transcriptase domain-containing protein [Tanacetum cinerariifolium]
MASKPKILQEAIELAKSLTDQKVRAYADRKDDNKRRMDNNSRYNNAQQPSYKRQNVARAYSVWPSKKEYAGTLSLCNKCKFYHNGLCTVTCMKCKRVGHLTRDCRSPTPANNQRTITCFEWSVMASKPKILQEAIELAKSLTDQKVRAYADRKDDNKRRMDNNSRYNNAQQPSYKRQNVARAYSVWPSKKEYAGTLSLCNKCKFYHNGLCTVTCMKLVKRVERCMPWDGEADQSPINIKDEADA